jgi:hypothetical protein
MKQKITWTRVVFITGVVAFCLGTLDPLEGSVVIILGSFLIALSAYFKKDRHWKIFLSLFLLIAVGVFALFYLSSLGGFGGTSDLSWWWGLFILPYPLGWLATLVLLIVRAFKKPKLLETVFKEQ